MSAHRKDDQANAMYEAYQSGLSLARVGAAFGLGRQTVYAAFKRRGFELRQRPAELPAILYSPACNQFNHNCGKAHS